uniref:MATH domain-containing protein n=1 Tax=Strigamia maritima TaxID=126957 RepID=T1J736_STRMM
MDSMVITCFKCGLKSRLRKDQLLCGDICCQQCGQLLFQNCLNKDFEAEKGDDGGSHSSDKQLCSYCNIAVDDMNTIQSHYDICDMYPISCNFCSQKFIRRTIKIHAQECLRSLRRCKFSPIGCQFQREGENQVCMCKQQLRPHGSQLEIERHEGDNNVHVELMMNLILNLQTEVFLKQNEDKKSSEEESDLKKIIKNQEMEINLSKKQMIDLELKIKELEHNYESLTKQQTEQCDNVVNYEKTLTTVITANNQLTKSVVEDKKILSGKIDAISAKQNQFEVDYVRGKEEMKIELKNKVSSFPYIWKVEKYAQLRHLARYGNQPTVFSQPFYSDKRGYKMRLQLGPNGFDDGEGTHLSVFLQVMKSPHDAILTWPIQYTAKVSILDQLNHEDHYFEIFESKDLCKEDLNRPIDDYNLGYGNTTFIPIDQLKPLHLLVLGEHLWSWVPLKTPAEKKSWLHCILAKALLFRNRRHNCSPGRLIVVSHFYFGNFLWQNKSCAFSQIGLAFLPRFFCCSFCDVVGVLKHADHDGTINLLIIHPLRILTSI